MRLSSQIILTLRGLDPRVDAAVDVVNELLAARGFGPIEQASSIAGQLNAAFEGDVARIVAGSGVAALERALARMGDTLPDDHRASFNEATRRQDFKRAAELFGFAAERAAATSWMRVFYRLTQRLLEAMARKDRA